MQSDTLSEEEARRRLRAEGWEYTHDGRIWRVRVPHLRAR
jgi:hypothetical protein